MVGVEQECLDAFCLGNKEEALKLLPILRSPETTIRSGVAHVKGWTLLHHAAANGWEDVCKLLVEKYNCEPTAVADNGWSPLHVACFFGKEVVVKYLVSLPSVLRNIDDKDNDCHTPLYWACYSGKFAVVEILLQTNYVNITEEDKHGHTPFELLSKQGCSVLNRLASKIDWNTQLKVKSYFNVFLTGNTGTGKSTLAETMLELTRDAPTQHGRISNVKELTAGVVPTQCEG